MQLNARIKHKRDTASNWANKNPTPLDGEIIIVETDGGDIRLKVGDGVTKYNVLPFLDEGLTTQLIELDNLLSSKADKEHGIFYIEGTGSTAGTWLGSHSGIAEYYPGLMIAYKPNIAGATGLTLNINGLGAVAVVRNTTTAVTTHYGASSILMLVYTVDSNGTAYWKIADYDSDTKTRSSNKASTKMYIIGATSQSTSGQTTYSNSNCYIGTDNKLYSGGKVVIASGDTASKATADASGNVITDTYLTKDDASSTYLGKSAKAVSASSADAVAWSNVTGKPSTFAPSSHNQASNTINALTGYSKASSASALATTDTLNSALGKLEKALDGKLSTSGTASKATSDASGNNIANTYATKTELTNGLSGKSDTSHTHTNASMGQGFCTCDTATATSAKTATFSGFQLVEGAIVGVLFNNAVGDNATLNINSTGAKPIWYKRKAIVNGVICGGEVGFFAYDGNYWNLLSVDRNRFYTSLVPYGTNITASESSPVDLNTPTYNKVGNYFCSANAQAKYVSNIPESGVAFVMSVSSPLAQTVDNETGAWVYRIRRLTHYTGDDYIQYNYTDGTGGNWKYGNWEKLIKNTDTASTSSFGVVKVGSNLSVSSGTLSLTKDNVTSALGYTPPTKDTVYTLPTASSSTLGGVKTTSTVTSTSGLTACPIIGGVPYYKDTNNTYTLSSFGITATSTELNYVDGVTSNIQTQLNGKLGSTANASSASKLATARTISLSGAVSGSASFDGSKNVTISTTSGQHISNKGSGEGYIKLGTMVADDSGNFGNFTFSGRFGGWEQGNSANYEIMMLNRSSARDGNTITATVSSSGEVANALSVCDIVVYKQTDTTSVVYLKLSGYWLYDFDWSAYQHSIVYDGTSTTTTPTGTLIWTLSGAPKTILDASGKLNTNGGNIGGHVYLTGAQENSSTSNTSQIVFGTADNNHVAISSNNNALVINPDTSTTANQIVLYLEKPSVFPSGLQASRLIGTADKATSDGSGNNIANTYITKSSANSSFIGGSRGELDIDTLYDVGNHMIAKGSNCPSANEYGVAITLPYRKLKGNSIPDFGAQIFIPNGDDDTKPNSMFFRTSLGNSWNAWQEVMTRGMVQSSTTDLTAGSSALADGNIYLVYE